MRRLHIMHCSPEVYPFSKTGGLADVSWALPRALSRLGHEVVVVTPLYQQTDSNALGVRATGEVVEVTLGGVTRSFVVHQAAPEGSDGVRYLLLENQDFFDRPNLYGIHGQDYPDNHLRFGFFSAAVLRLFNTIRQIPDVVHCHDWQTGLVSAYNVIKLWRLTRTVFTIHNLAYQGLFPPEALQRVGLPWEVFNPDGLEFYGKVNYLKSGIVYSDKITTVSPTYAREITTEAFGCGLDGILRKREDDLQGILNGVDYSQWNPATDRFIPANYDVNDLSGKEVCRQKLRQEFELEPDEGHSRPLFGLVGRLVTQKGFDLVAESLSGIVSLGADVVLVGTGDREIEEALKRAAHPFKGRVGIRFAFDEALAHLIEAGSDFFLMPSRYEPCGLNQMYSMKYGTLPVVHAVGGLEDSVVDTREAPEAGTGIKFREFSKQALLDAVRRALGLFADSRQIEAVRRRAMLQDFSWSSQALKYETLYYEVCGLGRGRSNGD